MKKIFVLVLVFLATMASTYTTGSANNANQKTTSTGNLNRVGVNAVNVKKNGQAGAKGNNIRGNPNWVFENEKQFMVIVIQFIEVETLSIDPVIF